MDYQLIIIGAGPGGYETALHAARKRLSVLLIEASKPGGTCLNEGCIPTKAFCKNAEVFESIRTASTFGIEAEIHSFNLSEVVARKNKIVDSLVSGIDFLLKQEKVTYLQGEAHLVDGHTVEVEGKNYSGDHIILATGSVSKHLPIEGADLPGILTSKELLDLEQLPSKMCFIGGGVIGMEFASIFQRFGCEVHVIEFAKEILPNFDHDISKRLKQLLGKKGVNIQTQAAVQYIRQAGEKDYIVGYQQKGKEFEITVDAVVMAVGRTPNIRSLHLDHLPIEFTPQGITTDENMRTTLPSVYAIGDLNGRCMLAHAATYQGIRAVNHILGMSDNINLQQIPAAVFTAPEVATVGVTEEMCKQENRAYKTRKAFFRSNGKAVCMDETEGLCKIIVDEHQHTLIGCHIIGPHAADLIHEMNLIIEQAIPLPKLQSVIHIHPTLSELLQEVMKE